MAKDDGLFYRARVEAVAGSALELGVSENTIRTLRRRAYRKLGLTSATQVVALVLGAGS